VEQANNLEVFKSKHNMGANYALDYHRGTVTPIPVQVSTNITNETKFLRILKNCQTGTFLPMHDNQKIFGPNDFI
jgi:hypothetical protein